METKKTIDCLDWQPSQCVKIVGKQGVAGSGTSSGLAGSDPVLLANNYFLICTFLMSGSRFSYNIR